MKNTVRKIFTVNIVVIMLVLFTGSALAAPPAITADAAIVVDMGSGEVLYEKNADKREYPASVTKVMTCLLALESGRTNRIVEVSPSAANVESTRLHGGERVRLKDLLIQMMLISDNGAATAVGESLAAGDIDYFATLMNRRAAKLGATATHFVNANGMPDSDHYTTARDLARISRFAFTREDFRAIVATAEKTIYYVEPAGASFFWENTNELLTTYPGCIGGKTGWTNAARGCLMVAAARDGRKLLAIVLHSDDDETRFSEAAALLDYGFSIEPVK